MTDFDAPSPSAPCPKGRQIRPVRVGSALIWLMLTLVPLSAVVSLAVDWGHVQMVRSQMQNSADDVALGVLDAYIRGGWSAANAAAVSCPADNPIAAGAGITPTITVVGGTWTAATRSFAPNVFTGTPAVRVIISCTQANNNAVRLAWGKLIGIGSVDVKVMAIAARDGGETAPVSIPSRANLHLSGMPNGTTTSWGDDIGDATPYQVTSIPVTPGEWISFTNFSGTSSILPGQCGYYGAAGNPAMPLNHGENWNGSPNNPGPENGIADAVIPASAVTGLFLSDDVPSTNSPPAIVDWTQPSQANKAAYHAIEPQQPFMIGNGMTSGGAVKKFRVPQGATRMFLSVWDGVQQNNNGGTVNGTVQVRYYAKLVR